MILPEANAAELLRQWAQRSESALDAVLPEAQRVPQRLHSAMRYATLGGGKRIRPCLVYATGVAFGAQLDALDAAACAVELIHAYSLIHDDLPAMDNDALRRGKPTVHIAFDEATAILAGDALQALAFAALAQARLPAARSVESLRMLAAAAGAAGMAGGQAIDLDAVGQQLTLAELEHMHRCKTGALIRAAVQLGAIAADVPPQPSRVLDDFADALGLAFQICDDLLDVEGNSAELGKTAGKDAASGKPTYVSLLGIETARSRLAEQRVQMAQALDRLDLEPSRSAPLRALAQLAAVRSH